MSEDFYRQSILPHAGIISKICRTYTNSSEDYEDYFQEVCLQIWKSRHNFTQQSKWSTWIYKISLNVCLTLLKKRKNQNTLFVSDHISYEKSEENKAFKAAPFQQLYHAIKNLSEIDRAIILLYLEEKPYKEIAEITGTSTSNISTRVNRIKSKLKQLLDEKVN